MSSAQRDRLTAQALAALATAYGITTVHHLYGGVADGSTRRLMVPLILLPAVLASAGVLVGYRRTGRHTLLVVYACLVTVVVVGLLGLFHGGYAHVYKDLVFLTGAPASWYVGLNPDEHYPPDDLFFELTGVLDLAAAALVGVTTLRMVQAARRRTAALVA
jgi:hypothetical protein